MVNQHFSTIGLLRQAILQNPINHVKKKIAIREKNSRAFQTDRLIGAHRIAADAAPPGISREFA